MKNETIRQIMLNFVGEIKPKLKYTCLSLKCPQELHRFYPMGISNRLKVPMAKTTENRLYIVTLESIGGIGLGSIEFFDNHCTLLIISKVTSYVRRNFEVGLAPIESRRIKYYYNDPNSFDPDQIVEMINKNTENHLSIYPNSIKINGQMI